MKDSFYENQLLGARSPSSNSAYVDATVHLYENQGLLLRLSGAAANKAFPIDAASANANFGRSESNDKCASVLTPSASTRSFICLKIN